MITVPVRGSASSIAIEVLGYEDAEAADSPYGDWLRCRVSIVVGAFTGAIAATFTAQNFEAFQSDLTKVLDDLHGTAAFVSDEEWLQFDVTMGRTGHCTITGKATVYGGPQTTLSFSFDSDQSYLTETMRGLEDVLKTFPARQSGS